MKLAKARALALACRPVGKIAHASTGGNDQFARTALTVLSLNSSANIHSDAMAIPRPASTHFRTPTVVFRRTRPPSLTDASVGPFRKEHVGPHSGCS